MLETILIAVATSFVAFLATLIIYARWHYGSLEKLGIPVAQPHFFLGSDPDGHLICHQERDLERFKKYGPVFGIYEGRTPRIFVIDPEMIRLIMVKDFDHFYDRTQPDWGHAIWNNLLDFLPGEKWKTMRSGITPMFTSSRIRNGGKAFSEIIEKYLPLLKKEMDGESIKFDMKDFMTPVFVEFTMDYFLSLKVPKEVDIRDDYVMQMIKDAVAEEMEPNFLMNLMTVYPQIIRIFGLFDSSKAISKFLATLDQAIKMRREMKTDTSSGKDFIDVMISMFDKLDSDEYKKIGIEKVIIQAQAFEMFIAGYDSILGTLGILPYFISKDLKVQEKLLEEIDNGGDGEYPYLTACVREAIRLSPAFNRLERLCMKDWTYENEKGLKLTIPKGTSVVVPAWATNRNPDVFKEPDEFRPERYYKAEPEEKAKYAMSSFGHGPRNCIGMRMGIEMVKAGMIRMMKEFTFEVRNDTKLELLKGVPFITRYRPVHVNLIKRKK